MRSSEKRWGEGAIVKRIPQPLHYLSVKSRCTRDSLPRGIHPDPLVPQQAHSGPPKTGQDAPPLFVEGQAIPWEGLCQVQSAKQAARENR